MDLDTDKFTGFWSIRQGSLDCPSHEYLLNEIFSIVLDAKVSVVTVSKLVDVAVKGSCKC